VIKEQATYIKKSVESLEEHLVFGSSVRLGDHLAVHPRLAHGADLGHRDSDVDHHHVFGDAVSGLHAELDDLLALTLAVGIVIDDAIIVLENIYRWLEEKPGIDRKRRPLGDARDFARRGGDDDLAGHHLRPDRLHVGLREALPERVRLDDGCFDLVSMLVAFTLTPTLSARVLKIKRRAAPHRTATGDALERNYLRLLNWSLNHRWVIVLVSVVTFSSTLFPIPDDRPRLDAAGGPVELGVSLETPEGTSLEATERVTLEIARKIEKVPGVIGDSVLVRRFSTASAGADDDAARAAVRARAPNNVANQVRDMFATTPTCAPRCASPTRWAAARLFADSRHDSGTGPATTGAHRARSPIAADAAEPSLADMRANLQPRIPRCR
jgi:hydrophobic/amphiphilic exporter-1 (mainly G- bacteria), HAE1 family